MNPYSQFCSKCGRRTGNTNIAFGYEEGYEEDEEYEEDDYTGHKTVGSYFVASAGAMITFFIRLMTQEASSTWNDYWNNRMYVGVDPGLKPIFTFIPLLAAIIISVLLVTDDETGSTKKKVACIVNVVLIILSLLFIWVDIPQAIY